MANLISETIRCSNCAFWYREAEASIWGVCVINFGSQVDIDIDNDEGSSNSCFVDEIRTDEEFFCANFLSTNKSCPNKVTIKIRL